MNMEQLERIRHYEAVLDGIAPVLAELETALDRFDSIQEDVRALSEYYGSEAWNEDLAADEAGRLPSDLKRGVLSEDGIYDVLDSHYQLTVRLLDTVSSILKNR
jgi:hypothetical protein